MKTVFILIALLAATFCHAQNDVDILIVDGNMIGTARGILLNSGVVITSKHVAYDGLESEQIYVIHNGKAHKVLRIYHERRDVTEVGEDIVKLYLKENVNGYKEQALAKKIDYGDVLKVMVNRDGVRKEIRGKVIDLSPYSVTVEFDGHDSINHGDSGAPYYLGDKLVGIHSRSVNSWDGKETAYLATVDKIETGSLVGMVMANNAHLFLLVIFLGGVAIFVMRAIRLENRHK